MAMKDASLKDMLLAALSWDRLAFGLIQGILDLRNSQGTIPLRVQEAETSPFCLPCSVPLAILQF